MSDRGIPLFDPSDGTELLRGWQLHTIRRRLIHERAARRAERSGYWLGGTATVFAAVAGSSAFATAVGDVRSDALGVVGLVVGVAAAVIAPLQSTLDLGGRAERHRQAAVAYKALLRTFERIPPAVGPLPPVDATADDSGLGATIAAIETRLADVDGSAPIVPGRLARSIELMPWHAMAEAGDLGAVSRGPRAG